MHLAFDVYGTLIDPSGIAHSLGEYVGTKASDISRTWRAKQLEYTFRLGLSGKYSHFEQCTAWALSYALSVHHCSINTEGQQALIHAYTRLPVFPDVRDALESLRNEGIHCHVLSNGREASLQLLIQHNGLKGLLQEVVSAEKIQRYKPDPDVYAYFCAVAGVKPEQAMLISGNAFDVIGAKQYGMKAVWIKRNPNEIFDPWGIAPDAVASSLAELPNLIPTL